MNLISCSNCAVVLDRGCILEPGTRDEEGIALDSAWWNGDEYVPTIECPVCKSKILYEDGSIAY